jgi:uncharacterized membrane protein
MLEVKAFKEPSDRRWLRLSLFFVWLWTAAVSVLQPALYWRYARWWEGLGYPAFVAMLAIFYLMVAKPDL